MMDFNDFKAILSGLFPDISERQFSQFKALDGLYRDWNARINVISRKDMDGLYCHHVLHSLAIAAFLKQERPSTWEDWQEGRTTVLDLGTGGGFPGIPLAILFPKTAFTLCDSIAKKIKVAAGISAALNLENVETVNARAESLGKVFGHVVTRAVASLEDLYPWVKGRYLDSMLCLKGGDIAAETGTLMMRHPLPVSTWKIPSWDTEGWFEGKYVVEIGPKKAK